MGGVRNGCMLLGALETLETINGVVPIIHSNSGCGIRKRVGKVSTPSTNLQERQIIFGGGSRLGEEIKNTISIIDGELYVVITGCTAELIGDDSEAMAREARSQGYPVIAINTAGFKGNEKSGYVKVVLELVKYFNEVSNYTKEKSKKLLINIFGIIPGMNPYYRGELEELRRIFNGIGVKVNTFFELDSSFEEWKSIKDADLNISLSKEGDIIVEEFEKIYGTNYLSFDYIPIGNEDTEKLLKKVIEKLNINDTNFINIEKRRYNNYLQSFKREYIYRKIIGKSALVGEVSKVIGINNFIIKTLGIIPEKIIITDSLKEIEGEEIKKKFDHGSEIIFGSNADYSRLLRESNYKIIFGGDEEEEIAEELGSLFIKVSGTEKSGFILDKGYLGYSGGINILKDLGREILLSNKISTKNKLSELEELIL